MTTVRSRKGVLRNGSRGISQGIHTASGLTFKDFIKKKGKYRYKVKSQQATRRWRQQMRNPAFARTWNANKKNNRF